MSSISYVMRKFDLCYRLALTNDFSSVFTREYISSFPVPDTKFQEAKLDYLEQLFVT